MTKRTGEYLVATGAIFMAIAVMAIVGNGDYEEAKREEALYCHMVSVGHWPDYEGVYALCPPVDLNRRRANVLGEGTVREVEK